MLIAALFALAPWQTAAQSIDIREWLVPWEDTGPSDPYVDSRGRVWFVGTRGDYVGNFSPQTAEFNRYDLQRGTRPMALLADANRTLWFASNRRRYIGQLDSGTGRVTEIDMPSRKAKEPRSLAFDGNGDIWFTAEDGNIVGRLSAASETIDLIELPTRGTRPFGITINRANEPWVAGAGRAVLVKIDPVSMTATEIALPNEESRLRRIVTTSDGNVWYTNIELGRIGRFDVSRNQFTEWPMPGGADSRPFAMAVDRDNRLWIVETGPLPNRLVGFDTATGTFLTETDIPSGAGSISHLHYHEASGEVWFGTETNYVGRARVH